MPDRNEQFKSFVIRDGETIPTAAAEYFLTRAIVQSAGLDDVEYVCLRNSGGTYSWVDTTASAPVDAKYITQTANATLTNEQSLGALATGILKSTTTTGVLSIAVGADLPSHTHIESDTASLVSDLAGKQPLDADLTAIAALASAANKVPYSTGAQAWALADFPASVRTFLTTPSSANWLAVLTDETGSGAAVFGTAPTISSPVLIAANSPVTARSSHSGSDTASTASTVTYSSAITLTVTLPAGTWEIKAVGGVALIHSASGKANYRTTINADTGASQATENLSSTLYTSWVDTHELTGVAGGGTVDCTVEFKSSGAGTTGASNPWLWVTATRTA